MTGTSTTGAKVFLIVIVLLVSGIGAFNALQSGGASATTSSSSSTDGFGPALTISSSTEGPLSSTTGSSQTPLSQNSTSEVGGVPQIMLDYQQMLFTGASGSYCLPSAGETADAPCAPVSVPLNMAVVPTVGVYPNPQVSLGTGAPGTIPSNGTFAATLYSLDPIRAIVSITTSALDLNFTSGEYLLSANFTSASLAFSDYFLLSTVPHANAAVDDGVRIEIGQPQVDHDSLSDGPMTSGFVGLENWPIEVYSNVTTDVDLSAMSVMMGNWVQFVPSHLTDVGPNGTSASMLIAGAVEPFVDNDFANVSLIIRGVGSDGLSGQATLPLEGGSLVVPITAGTSDVAQNPRSWMAILGSTQYDGGFGMVYDLGGVPGNATTTTATVSVAGMMNGSQLQPMPSWMSISIEDPTVTLQAYVPTYEIMSITASSQAPVGTYYVLFDIATGSQNTRALIEIWVMPPMIG